MNQILKEIEEQIINLEILMEDFEYEAVEEILETVEEEVHILLQSSSPEGANIINKLYQRIKKIRKELESYEEDAELDMMFPDREDDDFDEDTMAYDSVFGDD